MSDLGNWGDSADDDGSELIRTLSRLVPFSDVEVSSESEESEESTDEALDTVSEKSYHSDGKAEKSYHSDGKTAPTYLAAAKKNLPEEENVEKVSYRPSYLSDFEKEHFHRENVMPDRPYTAFFTAPSSAFTTKDIFDALLTDGIPASAVRCLQRSPNGNVLITFASKRYRDLFLRRSSFVVRRGRFVTHPGSRRLLFVTIYDAPHELPDSAIEHRLAKYGRIFSSRRGKVSGYPDVFNGLRHLRMDIVSHIPCFLRFGKYQIRVKYDGQPTTCRRCNARDHLFKDCKNEICFNCDSIGHHARMCPEDMRCCICKEEGHLAIDCQHSWYRRPPPSLGLSPETVADDPVADPTADTVAESPVESAPAPTLDTVAGASGPASTAEEPSSHVADTEDTCPSQPDAADLESQPDGSVSAPDLDSQVPLFSGDQPSPSSEAAVPATSPPADTFVPSVSDSTLGRIPSASEDPVPSVTDSALAEVVMPHVPEDPVPSVSDSTLAEVDLPPASVDLAPSVSDSALAQVPSPSDAPALDLIPPDEDGDDDDMGDSVPPLETEKLATAWKRISRKKGQSKKKLARKAAAPHSFAPARKATRPNPPGVRPNRGKDPPE